MEYYSVKRENANKLRKFAYKKIVIFCNQTGANYFSTVKNCQPKINNSRFKYYLNFAINASKLTTVEAV